MISSALIASGAVDATIELATRYGILAGPTSGATYAAALEVSGAFALVGSAPRACEQSAGAAVRMTAIAPATRVAATRIRERVNARNGVRLRIAAAFAAPAMRGEYLTLSRPM